MHYALLKSKHQYQVCFEMANIKQMRLKMEYVTISKSEHDFLVTQAIRIKLR